MPHDKATILVVDDNPTNLSVLVDYLDEAGFEVMVAENGDAALELLVYSQPDLILLDVMMPGQDGFEVCQRLKSQPTVADIPVIFMTALSDTADKVRGFQVGAVDYITKPIQHEEMLARVNSHLTIRKLQLQLRQANQQLEKRVAQRTAELAQANTNLAVANSELAQANADLQAEIDKRRAAYDSLNKINAAYSRFVPKEMLRLLNQQNIVNINLGDHRQMEMTIMFADIRSFTTLSEQMSVKENFNFVNAYFKRVSPIIRRYHGFVDKYIGDAIMALFPTRADEALQAAIAMFATLGEYNQTRNRPNRLPINIGIGLHRGQVMLGTVGEPERLEGTVISDAVNLAARLEGLTKLYGSLMVISESVLAGLDPAHPYEVRFLAKVKVRGKQQPVNVFEVLDGLPSPLKALRLKTRPDFEQGLARYYYQDFDEAIKYFVTVLTYDPQDKAAQLYQQQSAKFLKQGVPTDWLETDIDM